MGKMLNYIIILAFNAFILFNIEISGLIVICFCFSLIFLGLEYVLTNSSFVTLIYVVYVLASIELPELILFYPIVIAGAFRLVYNEKNKLILFPYIFTLPIVLSNLHLENSIILFIQIFGSFLAISLVYNNIRYVKLTNELIKAVDDSRETTYLLKERNKSIVEKQDHEVYAATLRERNRIAREIHDNVGHLISRAILVNGAIKAINQQKKLEVQINSMDEALNIAMSTIRNSVHDMHNESINLYEAITSLTDDFNKCSIDFKYNCSINIPTEIKYSFISIVKEALSNIAKHSNATKASITIREHPAIYQLIIIDNGNINKYNDDTPGLGLTNMRDRIKVLHGNINIKMENGFEIFITIPKIIN